MRLVKAAKASSHAKFYNLSTGYVDVAYVWYKLYIILPGPYW